MNELISIKAQLPEAVYQKVHAMGPVNITAFVGEFRKQSKSLVVAYIFWAIGSLIGLHYLYLKKPLLFFLYLFTIGGLGIWWLIDAFRLPGMIKIYNKSVALNVLHDIQVVN